MNGASVLASIKPSWVLNAALGVLIIGGFVVSDQRFRSHVEEREVVVEKRLGTVEREQTNIEDDIDSLRESMSENAVEFAKLATTTQHIREKVDQILVEIRRP